MTASPRIKTLLSESGFRDNPLFRLYPAENIPGWDDEWHSLIPNGDRIKKSPAHLGFSWLLYTLTANPRKWVCFAGAPGMGKTHLSCVLGTAWILRMNRAGLIAVWPDVLRRMREKIDQDKAGFMPSSDTLRFALEQLISVPFLVMDDVSAGRTVMSDWALDNLFLVLNGRIGKPTILTMNQPLDTFRQTLRATGFESGLKAADRLEQGEGGNVAAKIPFTSKKGSYRAKS